MKLIKFLHCVSGPRFPVPILGDAYILGNDLEKGFKNLTLKHGKICGLWLGPQRAVVVSDFEILQEMLNKPETSDRQIWAVAGNYHHNSHCSYLNIYISRKIRLCVVDLEGQFQTTLQAKPINLFI